MLSFKVWGVKWEVSVKEYMYLVSKKEKNIGLLNFFVCWLNKNVNDYSSYLLLCNKIPQSWVWLKFNSHFLMFQDFVSQEFRKVSALFTWCWWRLLGRCSTHWSVWSKMGSSSECHLVKMARKLSRNINQSTESPA